MGQSVEITRELLADIERFRNEIMESANTREKSLQYDLTRAQRWSAWCQNATPAELYQYRVRLQKESEEREAAEKRRDRECREREQYAVQQRRDTRLMWIFLCLISTAVWLSFLWFRSNSYGNFCYQIGNSIISGILGIVGYATIIAVGYFINRPKKL